MSTAVYQTAGRTRPVHAGRNGKWRLRVAAITYLGFIIVLPLSAIVTHGFADGVRAFWSDVTNPTAFGALRLTILASVILTVPTAY